MMDQLTIDELNPTDPDASQVISVQTYLQQMLH